MLQRAKKMSATKEEMLSSIEFAESIINTIHEPLIVLDADLKVISASLAFYQTFKVNPKDTVGHFIYELGNHQWDIPQLRELLENILPQSTTFNKFEVEHEFVGIGKRTMLLNARQILRSSEKSRIILLAIEDITERKIAEFAAMIIDTIREPLVVLDADLKIISANRSFYKTFKVTPEETIGKLLHELGNRQWDIPQLHTLLDDIINNNTIFDNFETTVDLLIIGPRTMRLYARRIIPEESEKKLLLLSLEDISRRREAELELDRIIKAKSNFTSMVSHELRTPLTSLKHSIGLLAQGKIGPLNQQQNTFLEIAERNLDRLVNLINDVLDFQKLDTGKMTYKMEKNSINLALKEMGELMGSLIEKKGLNLIIEIADNLPKINFDKNKIIQVLTNLVNNALRSTEKGSIIVTARKTSDFIQISIQDSGKGIQLEDIPKLFQEYEQLERKGGGTGLGLIISKDIISAHNGKIWIESAFGKGTTVHFTLPIL